MDHPTVAVTGANGLLGGSMLRSLQARHWPAVLLSRHAPVAGGGEWRRWDACDSVEQMLPLLAGVDVVVHCAAYLPPDMQDPQYAEPCWRVNAQGTLNLLEAARRAGVRHFIYASGANLLRQAGRPLRENDAVGGEHAPYYFASKVAGEIYARGYDGRGLPALIVRPSSLYGHGMIRGAVLTMADKLRRGIPLQLRDGGRYTADLVWADDVAWLICAAIGTQRAGVVNVGSGSAISLLDLAGCLADLVGASRQLIEIEPPLPRSTHPGFAAVDNRRAASWFGYRPTPIQTGLQRWCEGLA